MLKRVFGLKHRTPVEHERCPECKLTADGRDYYGKLVWGCCLNDWHVEHDMTAEQAERRREEEEVILRMGEDL